MEKISRKGFLKVAAAAAMSGVTAGALAACNSAASSSTAASGDAIYTAGTYTGTATGIGEVKVTMTFSETAITEVVIDASNETESIGGVAAPTLQEAIMAAQGTEIDNISGATVTTNAVKKAAASCIEQAMGVKADGADGSAAASENDWLWSAHSDDLWSASKKSAYDPCPYGWRVAPSAVFDGLKLVGAPTAADADKYGWGLTDPERGTSSLFIGAGRRRYDNSTILNVYNPVTVRSVAEEAQPWEGLYWTAGTLSGTKSPAFHFWFEKKTTGGGLENNVPYARANGMSVRCVRVQ